MWPVFFYLQAAHILTDLILLLWLCNICWLSLWFQCLNKTDFIVCKVCLRIFKTFKLFKATYSKTLFKEPKMQKRNLGRPIKVVSYIELASLLQEYMRNEKDLNIIKLQIFELSLLVPILYISVQEKNWKILRLAVYIEYLGCTISNGD